jgi:hypothetical protein
MTPTETLAVKLFVAEVDEHGFSQLHFNPDDWNDIRRMEDALAERNLHSKYTDALYRIVKGHSVEERLKHGACFLDLHVGLSVGISATTAQRVAACLRVLQDAGL